MNRAIQVLGPVWGDVHEAAQWYDTVEGAELGDRFVDAFHASWADLQ